MYFKIHLLRLCLLFYDRKVKNGQKNCKYKRENNRQVYEIT